MYIYDKVTQNDLNKYGLFLSQNFKLKQDVILSGIVQVTEYCNMYLTDFEEVSDGILVNEDTLLHLVDGIDGVLYEIFIKSNDKYRVYTVSCGPGESKTVNIGDFFDGEVIFNPITYYILYDGSVVVSDTVLLSVAGTGDVIQSGDSVTVTALLSQGNVGVSGVVLDYSIVHDDTTISSGTVTTDSNGEATISYAGTGVGDVTVTVSYGSLLTETYNVYDCIAYDKTTSANDFWTYWQSNSNMSANTVTVDDTGILIETDSTAYSTTYMQIWLQAFKPYTNVPLCYEFDTIEISNFSVYYPIIREDGSTWWASTTLTGHIKIEIKADNVKLYQDDVLVSNVNGTFSTSRLYLQSIRETGDGYIKFKNLKIYSL